MSEAPLNLIGMSNLNDDAMVTAAYAEDVYFWRNGEVKPLKRRNAPLEAPEWIRNLEGVDR